jgi:hypothetical protein
VVGTFKANNPLNTFLLFVYGLLLKFSFFADITIPVIKKTDAFLFKKLLIALKPVGDDMPFIYAIIVYLLLFTQALSFNKFINNQRLVQRSTYLPAMSYLLITSMFTEWNELTAPLVINTLLIWSAQGMSTLYNSQNPKTTLFNIGMIIGIAAFFYFPSLAFSILIAFALIFTRPFKLNEWIIALIGIITPFYFFFAWLFLSDNLKNYKLPVFIVGYPRFHQSYWSLAAIILVLIAFITGAWFVRSNLGRQIVQVRNNWGLMLIYLVVAIFIPFINNTYTFEYWILAAVPLSAFIASAFFYPSKKWLPVLLHWIMVGFVIAISYLINNQA